MSPEFGLPTKGWGAWNDMTDIQHLRAYELLQESIPDSRDIRKATGNERKIQASVIKFNDTLQRKIDALRAKQPKNPDLTKKKAMDVLNLKDAKRLDDLRPGTFTQQ